MARKKLGAAFPAPSAPVFALYCACSVATILIVPRWVPVKPSTSLSYVFGYNNSVGVLLLVLLTTAGALWLRGSLPLLSSSASEAASQPIPRSTLYVCLALTLALCAGLALLVNRVSGLGESGYGIDRVWLLSQGHRPYLDFEWPFGASLLYVPLWTARALGLDLVRAYYLVWTIASAGGVALLYATVNRISWPGARKKPAFLLLYFAMTISVFSLGLHYTGMRYLTSFYFVLVLDQRQRGQYDALRTMLLASLFCAIQLAISPEVAVAFVFACTVLLFPGSRFGRAPLQWPAYGGVLGAFLLLFVAAARLHVLDTMLASSSGADALPIIFSVPALFFFATFLFCLCLLVQKAVRPDPARNASPIILISIPMLAGALTRADPGHMFWNGIGLFLVALLALSAKRKTLWYRFVFGLIWVALPACFIAKSVGAYIGITALLTEGEDALPGHHRGFITRVADFGVAHLPASSFRQNEEERMGNARKHPLSDSFPIPSLYPELFRPGQAVIFNAPFGYSPTHTAAFYLSSQVDAGFYKEMENATTPAAIARKVQELQAHPERPLLLAYSFEAVTGEGEIDVAGDRRVLSQLNLFPYLAQPAHTENLMAPLFDYIHTHYRLAALPSPENFEYEVWLPK